jgi:hypothetical protein
MYQKSKKIMTGHVGGVSNNTKNKNNTIIIEWHLAEAKMVVAILVRFHEIGWRTCNKIFRHEWSREEQVMR